MIEKRRSDVPLKPHRRKFPSFGSGKIADSGVRESSAVIRPPVVSSFSLLFNDIRVSKSWKRVRISDFSSGKHHKFPGSAEKEEKRHRKQKRKPDYFLLCPLKSSFISTLSAQKKFNVQRRYATNRSCDCFFNEKYSYLNDFKTTCQYLQIILPEDSRHR